MVSLDEGDLEALVRRAEGPEHRGIDHRRLDRAQKAQLNKKLKEVADLIRRQVGEEDSTEVYTPTGFAQFAGQETVVDADRPPRPRPPGGGGGDEATIPGGREPGKGGGGTRPAGRPRRGSVPRLRSLPLRVGPRGVLTARFRIGEKIPARTELGVRLRWPSGSDASCEAPLAHSWVALKSVTDIQDADRSDYFPQGGDRYEISVPASPADRRLEICLAEPVDDPSLIQIDIVRRKTVPSSEKDK